MGAIKVLVAEDSAATREYLVYLLGQASGLEVAGTARNGLEAVEQAERLGPDVVLMDCHMPKMDGCGATRLIMERVPTPVVLMSASLERREVMLAFQAMEAGALMLVGKPPGPDHPDQPEITRRLVEALRMMAEVKVVRRHPRREPSPQAPPPAFRKDRTVRLIAMAASTGGPQAIAEILKRLPATLGAPVLVVQHIAQGFVRGLAEWLGQQTRLGVKLAEAGEAVRPGTVYVAPDGAHMGIDASGRISLTGGPADGEFCPSASSLFESVAAAYGGAAMGVLLTGMGRDGAKGLKRLREAGGVTAAQDEDSSVVFGMPAEAIRLRAAEHVLSPIQISDMIRFVAMPR